MSFAPRSRLTREALEIWKAGVAAVDSARLVASQVHAAGEALEIAGVRWIPEADSRICVVGAGKAGSGMACGLEQALGPHWLARTSGWVNVPDDCVQPLETIALHGARPAGINEPTPAGVAGTQEILRRVRKLRPQDLCLVLISGGGSALLPAPMEGVSLTDKQQVTRLLMTSGATISELNAVRRCLSAIKGGGLLRCCGAGLVITLIISDVIGDPLETIASGPTVPVPADPQQALDLLEHYTRTKGARFPVPVLEFLRARATHSADGEAPALTPVNVVIGNNRTAVQASAARARELGYRVVAEEWDQPGQAASAGREFASRLRFYHQSSTTCKTCMITGGETTVDLSPQEKPGKGGRNQEFALAALVDWLATPAFPAALISGGTDGEDGPTDAAGAWVDAILLADVQNAGINPEAFLTAHDSYTFFDRFGGLLRTGPTQTNVMDLRVGLIDSPAD